MQNAEGNSRNSIIQGNPSNIWSVIRKDETKNVFAVDPEELRYRQMIRQHRAWLESIPHECPSPYTPYRIGVYIRFFNQTKYDDYLDYHKQEFVDTISLCPKWTLVDFYVDEGQSAPNMENARGWTRLLEDCFSGKVNLIVTQKISNVSRKPQDLAFISRILAAQKKPIGIYFISEDLFTLASYYQRGMKDMDYLPSPDWELLPDGECNESWGEPDETADE